MDLAADADVTSQMDDGASTSKSQKKPIKQSKSKLDKGKSVMSSNDQFVPKQIQSNKFVSKIPKTVKFVSA